MAAGAAVPLPRAHNGEINTITGNRNWAVARRLKFANELIPDLEELGPLVNRVGSDSSSMDNMLELMVTGGIDLFRGVRMIIPPAWQNMETMDADLRAFYEYNSMHMEPWDGPAGVVLTDGRHAVCLLDRNGLRPARWVTTKNGYITLASEIGVWDYKPEDVIAKGRVGPGQILAVDTETGQVLDTDAIDNRLKSRHPYKQWLRQNAVRIQAKLDDDHGVASYDADQLKQYMKMFQVTFEERDQVLRPLGEQGQEAVGSMGDDTPMAVLSPAHPLAVRLLPPAVRPGDQPADRPAARVDRHVPGNLPGRRAQHLRGIPGPRQPRHAEQPGDLPGQVARADEPDHPGLRASRHRPQLRPGHRPGSRGAQHRRPGRGSRACRQGAAGAHRPPHRPGQAAGACRAGHRRRAPPPDREGPALRLQHPGRDRHRARSAPLRRAGGLRRLRGLPVPGLRGAGRPDPHRRGARRPLRGRSSTTARASPRAC